MKTESNIKPEAVAVDICANGIAEVVLRENIIEEERDGEIVYTYDEYRTPVPFRENLLENVKKTADAWLTAAKNAEYAELAAKVRAKRDALLKASDERMCLDRINLSPSTGTSFASWLEFLKGLASAIGGAWAKYRQALRDIPAQPGFPYSVEFPKPPSEDE